MSSKLDSCVKSVMEKGVDEEAAYAICNEALGLKEIGFGVSTAKRIVRLVKKRKRKRQQKDTQAIQSGNS
jgi:hypothetical protein